MAQVKILVVEDNLIHYSRAEILLDELGYAVCGHAQSATEAKRLIKATEPDIILMDIEIEGDTNGIQLAREVNETEEIPVIFTTSHKEPEIIQSAVKTGPYAYLVKPLATETLQASVELALHRAEQQTYRPESPKPEQATASLKDAFFIKLVDKIEKVAYADVQWVCSAIEEKYILIVTESQEYRLRSTLKQITERLPGNFIRVSTSHIVNVEKVTQIVDSTNTVMLGSEQIKMGRKYKKDLMELINLIG